MLGLVWKLFEPEAEIEPIPSLTADDQAILERFIVRRLEERSADLASTSTSTSTSNPTPDRGDMTSPDISKGNDQ